MALIKTHPSAQEATINTIHDSLTSTFQHLKSGWENTYNLIWHNPHGLTPKQVFELIGTDAAMLFAFSYDTGELINQAAAMLADSGTEGVNNSIPEGVAYTVNADGSVTIE